MPTAASAIAPGPGGLLDTLPNLGRLGRAPIEFFTELSQTHGDLVRLRLPRLMTYLVSHPDLVRQVLQERQQIYRKGIEYELLRPLLGQGLLTSDGAFWKRQRRLAQPAFHRQRITAFADVMVTRTQALCDRWAKAPGPTDVHADMMGLTLEIVGQALFGAEQLTDDRLQVGPALDAVLRFLAHHNRSLWALVPLSVPIPSHRRFFRDRAVLDGVVDRLIQARRSEGNTGRGDLLSLLMEARDEDGGPGMSDAQLRDECMTMLLAGHETTANLLSWTLLLLAQNPAGATTLRETVDAALRGAPPTLDDLPKLGIVDRVIKESLRLYPPAWAISRIAEADDEMRGVRIAKGSQVLISQYVIQRSASLWPDPERFDPDRFLEAAEKQRPRFAYFPFGGGPRQCIGNLFATLEAQLALIVLVQRSQVDIDPGLRVAAEPSITLRPRNGLPATVRGRN